MNHLTKVLPSLVQWRSCLFCLLMCCDNEMMLSTCLKCAKCSINQVYYHYDVVQHLGEHHKPYFIWSPNQNCWWTVQAIFSSTIQIMKEIKEVHWGPNVLFKDTFCPPVFLSVHRYLDTCCFRISESASECRPVVWRWHSIPLTPLRCVSFFLLWLRTISGSPVAFLVMVNSE